MESEGQQGPEHTSRGGVEMEWIKRYVYEVTKRLPARERQKAAEDLSVWIAQGLEEHLQGGEVTEAAAKEVLTELGPPRRTAERLRRRPFSLVGPVLYPAYVRVLGIVLLALLLAMTTVLALQSLARPSHLPTHLLRFAQALFIAGIQGFAWVTLIFAALERFGGEAVAGKKARPWSPEDLSPVPDASLILRPWAPLLGMVFSVLFGVLLLTNRFGVYDFHGEGAVGMVPFLSEKALTTYAPFLLLFLAVNFLSEGVLLRRGRWTQGVALAHTALNLLSLGLLTAMVLTFKGFWNPNFLTDLGRMGILPENSQVLAEKVWFQARLAFLAILFLSPFLDAIRGVVKFFQARRWGIGSGASPRR